jgi:hypothetical protein
MLIRRIPGLLTVVVKPRLRRAVISDLVDGVDTGRLRERVGRLHGAPCCYVEMPRATIGTNAAAV